MNDINSKNKAVIFDKTCAYLRVSRHLATAQRGSQKTIRVGETKIKFKK